MMNTDKSEHDRHATQATLLLVRKLSDRPDTTPLNSREFHAVARALQAHELDASHLLTHQADARQTLADAGIDDDLITRTFALASRGFALTMQQIRWEQHSVMTTTANEPDIYPDTFAQLGDDAPPAVHLCGNASRMRDPDNTVAVRTRGSKSPQTTRLIAQTAEKLAQSGRIIAVSIDQPAGLELLLKILQQKGQVIGHTSGKPILEAGIERDLRDAIIEGRLTLWTTSEPDRRDPADPSEVDRLISSLATRHLRLNAGPNPSLSQDKGD